MPDSVNADLKPPYATFGQFRGFIAKLGETSVPSRIDKTVFTTTSGSVIYSVIASLKYLELIDHDGAPTKVFYELAQCEEEQRKELMRAVILKGYPTLFSDDIDVSQASSGQFDEHLKNKLGAQGSTIDKAASFFIAAAKYSGIELSPQILERKPKYTAKKSNTPKTKKPNTEIPDKPKDTKKAPVEISEKALEYRLVDLMSDAVSDKDVMDAILKVIVYLKTKGQSDED